MRWVVQSLLTGIVAILAMGNAAFAQDGHQFGLAFRELADQIPDAVGQPTEDEHSSVDGDLLQTTTMGLMVWRYADNRSAFTDGVRTWVNGPFGVQERGNDERFDWESPEEMVSSAPPLGLGEGPEGVVRVAAVTTEPSEPDMVDPPSGGVTVPTTEDAAFDTAAERAALEMINGSRQRNGVGPLGMDEALRAVARAHARDMAERGYFGHSDPQGRSPFDRLESAGIGFRYAGEVLGYGKGYTPAEAVRVSHEMMMGGSSPEDGHRQTILDGRYSKVGIGVHSGTDGEVHYVSVFTD